MHLVVGGVIVIVTFPSMHFCNFEPHPRTLSILGYTCTALPADAMEPWLMAAGKESQPVGGLHPPLLRVKPSLKINEFCP